MRYTIARGAWLATFLLAATTLSAQEPPAAAPAMVGADRDAHGCIGSAGYRWCEREQRCVRPWELAAEKGFESSEQGFTDYCAGAR